MRPVAITIPPSPQVSGVSPGFPRAPYEIGDSRTVLRGPYENAANQHDHEVRALRPVPTIVGGIFGPPSPYRDIVKINRNVFGAGSLNPKNEYIQLTVAHGNRAPVNISGWTLVSDATGVVAKIPKGTEIPISGTVNALQDIIISPGERAIIVSGISPIGASFKENKCIGYFSSFQRFHPALPRNCPVPSSELPEHYGAGYIRDVACIEYVKTLSRCQPVLSPPPELTSACNDFLTKYLNYNGCIAAHKNDTNFSGDTWRIYLGRTSPMWRTKHEIVKLLDREGKTVDAFGY